MSHNAKTVFGQKRDSNPRPTAWQTSKKPNQTQCQVPVVSMQVVEASLQSL